MPTLQTYEEIVKNKRLAFYVFTHLRATVDQFEKSDVLHVIRMDQNYANNMGIALFGSLAAVHVALTMMRSRNLIFNITFKLNFWTFFKFYYLTPVLFTYPFRLYFRKEFQEATESVVNHYSYSSPVFEQALNDFNLNGKANLDQYILSDEALLKFVSQ